MSKLILSILFVGLVQHALVAPTIDHNIVNKLREKSTINVIVSMRDSTDSVLSSLRHQTFASREDRINGVANALKTLAAQSQKSAIALLEKESASYTALWITNQISVQNADMSLLEKLVQLNEVSTIEEERIVHLDEPLDLAVFENLPAAEEDEVQWGVLQMEAPKVWATGNTGQNIIIATTDTGARGTHEALRDNFVGQYGWFDPSGKTLTPNDGNGHGTHTTANIAGTARNVGVSKGSKWAACKGCASSSCSQTDLTACGQFFVCPTNADGTPAPNCNNAPHLVSNSWGGGRANYWYNSTVAAMRAANIVVLFSAGNSGPSCGSANSPGDFDNVIGVGSTTIDNGLSSFSSVGPTLDGERMKPDIAAPGSNVFSAYHTSDTAYASMSGTSMACPHAAGVVALLLQENQKLNYDQVLTSLRGGGVPTTPTGRNCGSVSEEAYPNHHVGYGRLNAVKTIATMHSLFGQ